MQVRATETYWTALEQRTPASVVVCIGGVRTCQMCPLFLGRKHGRCTQRSGKDQSSNRPNPMLSESESENSPTGFFLVVLTARVVTCCAGIRLRTAVGTAEATGRGARRSCPRDCFRSATLALRFAWRAADAWATTDSSIAEPATGSVSAAAATSRSRLR